MIAEHHYHGFGTGAVRLTPDHRDRQMHHLRRVARRVAAGPPPASCSRLLDRIKGVYNQGAVPACSAFAAAGMKSIQDEEEHHAWDSYEALECYHDCGGDDQVGIDPRLVLDYLQKKGLRVENGTARRRIGSYAFAPRDGAELFVSVLKSSLAAGQPFVIATRLPSVFGWDSNETQTVAYHELCGVAYDEQWLTCLNSYGPDWGRQGLCRLRWSYLTADGFQQGDCYAYTVIDALDDGQLPPGPPPPVIPPPPPVQPLSITSYLGIHASCPQIVGGRTLQIVGKGFGGGVVQAEHCGHALTIMRQSEHLLTVKMNAPLGPCVGPIIVQREGQRVSGPHLVVVPHP